MSKASEWAKVARVAGPRPRFRGDVDAEVDDDGDLYIDVDRNLSPADALALARWIIATFDDAPEATMTPEERAERLRQRLRQQLLFPEAKDSFVAIVAEEIRAAVAEEREACARIAEAADACPVDAVTDEHYSILVPRRGDWREEAACGRAIARAIRARAEGTRP